MSDVVSTVIEKMIVMSHGNMHDINHFMKVFAYARTIGIKEGLQEDVEIILEVAAVIHDIACPLCRQKYGNTNGKLQEQEGMPLAEEFLSDVALPDEMKKRIIYLVGHHHSWDMVDGMDYEILLEADFLVNADESKMSIDAIQTARDTLFQTETGKALLEAMYLNGNR